MDNLKSLSVEIEEHIGPGLDTFKPLLEKNKAIITSIPKKTFKYGATDRHQLDVYYPLNPATPGTKAPIIFFIYGGGFVHGDRNFPAPFDLLYYNIGAFFAQRGFITVVADYRLAPEFKYPAAGAEDILDAIKWAVTHPADLVSGSSPAPDLDSIFIMGHSAGATHAATIIFHQKLIPLGSDLRKRIKGVLLMGGIYHYVPGVSNWKNIAEPYWGTEENANANSPLTLLLSWFESASASGVKPPKLLVLQAENEPKWIYEPGLDLHRVLEWQVGESVEYVEAKGHIHVSLFCALSSGEGEEWGVKATDWMWDVVRGGGVGGGEFLKDARETDEHQCPKCQQQKTRSFKVEIGSKVTPGSKVRARCPRLIACHLPPYHFLNPCRHLSGKFLYHSPVPSLDCWTNS
ncbi:putative carboxylesterase 2 [Leucoagaricus sp. SymC.cos]|nr:putative carboxylesterase 2 [Leucoagaricus sp. SymC.cos]